LIFLIYLLVLEYMAGGDLF
jgi:serine/threonine protein kinase